jgi:Mn-dependent DtxR family transcriptional regulator
MIIRKLTQTDEYLIYKIAEYFYSLKYINQKQLSENTGLSTVYICNTIRFLRDTGYINDSDGRIFLTEKGWILASKIIKLLDYYKKENLL